MTSRYLLRAEYWRARADETRTLAESIPDTQVRHKLMAIADDYDEVAKLSRSTEDEEGNPKSNVVSLK